MQEHDPLSGGASELPQPTPQQPGESVSAQPRAFAASAKEQRGKNGHRARVSTAQSAAVSALSPKPPATDARKAVPSASAKPSWQALLAQFPDILPGWLTRVNWPLLLLLALLAGALAARLYGLDWDANQEQHPDERAIIMAVGNFQWPHSLGEFLSVRSPLSPHFMQPDFTPFFAYGTFPLYVLWLLAQFLNWLQQTFGLHWIPAGQGSFTDSVHLTLVGRALSALFDTGAVLVTYLLGRRLSGKKVVGLLAAAFVAFTPFEVQLAHFFTVDTALTFFVVLALYAYVGVAQEGGLCWVMLAGVATGLALASKFSALPLLLPLLLAYLLYWQRSEWLLAVPRMLISLGAGLLTFIIAMPYALLDLPDFQAAIKQQSDLTTGILDFPYVRQFAGTTPYAYELKNILLYDLGVPLALLALVGCIVVARRVWRDWRDAYLVPLAWVVAYFAITGSFYTKYSRYMLPIFPLLCIFGAAALSVLWQRGARRARQGVPKKTIVLPRVSRAVAPARAVSTQGHIKVWFAGGLRWVTRHSRWLAAGLVVAVLGSSFLFTLALDNIYSQPITRIQASRWLYQHVPSGNGAPVKTITYEIWDDSLPLAIDGQAGCYAYNCVGLPLYDDDTPQKATTLAQTLAQANAVVISSPRLYPDSIPRLPERYPMTNRYYQLLFAGKLGFHLAAVFQNSPNLFGIHFDDSGADESHYVFDHPTVHIFLPNATRPTAAQLDQLLTAGLTLPPPISLSGAQKPLTLTPAQMAANQASPPLGQQFPADSLANQHPLIVWWLVLEVMGLLVFPLVAFVLRGFRDRGWAFAKTIALLLIGYLVWLPASLQLLPYSEATTLGALALVGVAGLGVGWMMRADLKAFLRERWGLLLGTEALFTLAFLFFAVIRAQNPDLFHIWRGGEKPMDLAFINGILRSRYFPPLDAWFSGGYINYYYYGYYLVTILIRLTGVVTTTAFNLAIPTLFALVLTGGFSIVTHLTRRWWAGLIGGFFVAMLANLDGLHQVLAANQQHIPLSFDFWASSRVIPFTINEFPLWSFLFADLHPHVIDLPVEILAVGLAVALISERRAKPDSAALTMSRLLLLGLVLGAIYCINTWDLPTYALLIVLAVVWREYNALVPGWRLSYALVRRVGGALVVIAVGAYLFYQPFFAHFQTTAASGIGPVKAPDQLADYTTLFGVWLFIAASFFFVELYQWVSGRLAASLVAEEDEPGIRLRRRALAETGFPHSRSRWSLARPRPAYSALFWALALVAGLAFLFVFFALGKLLIVLYVLLALGLFLFLAQGRKQRSARQITYLFLLMGIGLSILVETIYIRDFLDNSDWERMNTVFKFFMQVWLFYSLGSALAVFEMIRWAWRARTRVRLEARDEVALARARWADEARWIEDEYPESASALGRRARQPAPLRGVLAVLEAVFLVRGQGLLPGVVRWGWSAGLAFLVLASSIFLVAGTQARISDHALWAQVQQPVNSANYTPTLDGAAYMTAWYPGDDAAIQWMNNTIAGTPVILEDSCGSYQWYGRVSVYTGLPTVMGWSDHEGEQRYGDEVGVRVSDVQTIYATTDPNLALTLIHKYDVQYIYLGQLERATCGDFGGKPGDPLPAAAVSKFDAMVGTSLQVVYQNPEVTIYKVIG